MTGPDPAVAERRVLVLGIDPAGVAAQVDAPTVTEALELGRRRLAERGFAVDLGLVALDEGITVRVAELLDQALYDCVVVGGGIRKPEPLLEVFEAVVNLIRRHAPQAAIAFNTSPVDSLEAVCRQLPEV